MEPFSKRAILLATCIATLLSTRGYKRKSLSLMGSIAAFIVGFLSMACGLRSGCLLLSFYQVATTATKYKLNIKKLKDGTVTTHTARGALQVFACSILAICLCVYHTIYFGTERPISYNDYSNNNNNNNMLTTISSSHVACGIIAHFATCLADTLASELGIFAIKSPILITQPWKSVPPGTNGGITILGTIWSGIGGLLIGLFTIVLDILVFGVYGIIKEYGNNDEEDVELLSYVLFFTYCFNLLLYGTICGLIGSLLDSILGATIQSTYWDEKTKRVYHSCNVPTNAKHIVGIDLLTNEQVNFISVAITTYIGGWIIGPYIFG